jgi:protein involved in polysaccharide export with SLBB domain
VDVPYFGLVAAMGKTCKQLASEVKELLEKQYYYRATVIIGLDQINRKRTLGKVYVVGQVRVNGPQEIPDDETYTVSKAILKAGGFSDFADKKKVKLVRGKGADPSKRTIVVNVAEIWEKGKVENDVTLEPDDLIFVPARLVNF